MPLWHHANVQQPGVARSFVDRIIKVELLRCTFARKLSQATQCNLDISRTQFEGVIEVAILAASFFLMTSSKEQEKCFQRFPKNLAFSSL